MIKVAVYIDGEILCENARIAAEFFYVCAWDPKNFKTGLHQLKIIVEVKRTEISSQCRICMGYILQKVMRNIIVITLIISL